MAATPARFGFHGTAAALSGRVIRPRSTWLDVGGASALPVEGGTSSATLPATDFGGVIGFRWAATHAQGDRHEEPVRRGVRTVAPQSTQAHTGAEVRDLSVVAGPLRISIGRLRAELTALCHYDARQPSIGAMDGACFDRIVIGKHRLSVAIDRRFFQTHDTHEKLCAACAAPHAGAARPRAVLSAPRPKGVDDQAPLLTTIVKSLRWIGRPYPRATIEGHVLSIPDVGRLYFGEMITSGPTRRLTMLRLALDGAVVLDAACCEVEAGGAWHR